LSTFVFEIFAKKLNKSQQNSCWELPELSEQQKKYAGLDAAVILEIVLKGHKPEIIDRTYKTTDMLASLKPKKSKKRNIYMGVENGSGSGSDSGSDSSEVRVCDLKKILHQLQTMHIQF